MANIFIKLDQATQFYDVEQGIQIYNGQIAEVKSTVNIQRAIRDNKIQEATAQEYQDYLDALPFPNGGTITVEPMTGDILDFSHPNMGIGISHLKFDPNGSNRFIGGIDSTNIPNNHKLVITHYGTSRRIDLLSGYNFALPSNRFELSSADIKLNAGESALFIYDKTIERWIAADK